MVQHTSIIWGWTPLSRDGCPDVWDLYRRRFSAQFYIPPVFSLTTLVFRVIHFTLATHARTADRTAYRKMFPKALLVGALAALAAAQSSVLSLYICT